MLWRQLKQTQLTQLQQQTAIETALDGIITVSQHDMRILSVNKAIQSLFGYPVDALIGKVGLVTKAIDPDLGGQVRFEGEVWMATANERITIQLPEDGNYLVAVHGWAIPAGSSTFNIGVLAVQGDGVSTDGAPDGPISPYRVYNLDVRFDTEGLAPGPYTGLITVGPPEGPNPRPQGEEEGADTVMCRCYQSAALLTPSVLKPCA